MQRGRLLCGVLGGLALASCGCGLIPVPYVADVTGTITGVRVLDAQTNEDIAGACASFHTGIAMTNWEPAWPPRLAATRECRKEDAPEDGSLSRDAAGVFQVPKRHGLGFFRPFGIGPLGVALYNPPIGVVEVSAPGYPEAVLLYYAGARPELGWTEGATVPCESSSPDLDQAAPDAHTLEVVRCHSCEDGVLRFYLRKLGPEIAEEPDFFSRRAPNGLVQAAAGTEPVL